MCDLLQDLAVQRSRQTTLLYFKEPRRKLTSRKEGTLVANEDGRWLWSGMMATSCKLRDRSYTRKDLREHSNPYKRQYNATQKLGKQGKPVTEKSQRVVILRQKKADLAIPQKLGRRWHGKTHGKNVDQSNWSLDRKFQEHQSPSDDAGTDENSEAQERQGEDGKTEASRQEEGMGDQILQFHQGVDELSKVLVAGFQKVNYTLKKQVELQQSEYVNQVAVLKDQNEILTNQVEKKTTECGEVEQIAAQLKNEVEQWKSKFVDCAVKLGREIETHRKLNEALRTEKDSFKEENDWLKRQGEKSIAAKVEPIATQFNKTVELLNSELVKSAELKIQNKCLKNQLAKWKTDCENEAQARKELESQLTAFWVKLGIAIPPSTSSGFTIPPTTERKPIRLPNEDAGNRN